MRKIIDGYVPIIKNLKECIFLIFIFSLISCSSENYGYCNLTGEILDRKNGNLFLYRPETSRFDKDTIRFVDGRFSKTISIKQPEVYWLFFEEDENEGGGFNPLMIFLEPGNVHIIFSYEDIYNYKIEGPEYNNKLYLIEATLQEINKTFKNLELEYTEIIQAGDSAQIKKLFYKADSLMAAREQIIYEGIVKNPGLVSAYYLWLLRRNMDKEDINKHLQPIASLYPNSRYVIHTKAYLDGFGNSQPSQSLKNYQLLTIKGNEKNLYGHISNNHLTLIVFWSSRCGYSDSKISAYRNVYERFKHLGFEIIGINNDFNTIRWQNAIERNNANWINLIDLDGVKAVSEYFHSDMEGDILVDNKGIVIARIKNSKELEANLNDLLTKK